MPQVKLTIKKLKNYNQQFVDRIQIGCKKVAVSALNIKVLL